MSPYDFDHLAASAKDRQAELLAEARQWQLLKQAMAARPHRPCALQWLKEVIDHLRHAGPPGTLGTRHAAGHH